jgi:hypothetical protein
MLYEPDLSPAFTPLAPRVYSASGLPGVHRRNWFGWQRREEAAVADPRDQVQPLSEAFRQIAWKHLQWTPSNFELHGNEVWNGKNHWEGKTPDELIAVYEDSIGVLAQLDIDVAYASIHKERLHARHGGAADNNAYLLALQFLLEKIERSYSRNKILIADEQKEHQLRESRWSLTSRTGEVVKCRAQSLRRS